MINPAQNSTHCEFYQNIVLRMSCERMNYDIPVVCAVCVLKTARSGKEGRAQKRRKKKSNIFKVIFKKHGNIKITIK